MRKPEAAIPEMSGKTPLQIMAEIGTEKLRRDYVHLLICKNLSFANNN